MKTKNVTFLSIGTNQGVKIENLQRAVNDISFTVGEVVGISSIYQTKAWGFESDDFYNICLKVFTILEPDVLIDSLLRIENKIGRVRNDEKDYLPRLIDIDILLYDSLIISSDKLEVPHPRMLQRKFVLIPLAEVTSDLVHPIVNKSIFDCLINCQDESEVVKLEKKLKLE